MKKTNIIEIDSDLNELIAQFERESGLFDVDYEIKQRSDGYFLVINIGNSSERFFKILSSIFENPNYSNNYFNTKVTIKSKSHKPWLNAPETRFLQKVLSESLTVDRYTFGKDFIDRYIKSITGSEEQLLTKVNHVVFGRRGSGKSSLLLYVKHVLDNKKSLNAWISMQTFDKRKDDFVLVNILREIFEQLAAAGVKSIELNNTLQKVIELEKQESINGDDIARILTEVRRTFEKITNIYNDIYIFLDDFHVIDIKYQPKILSSLYKFSRGNKIYFKISSIEIFSKLYDSKLREGLEIGNDIQRITLDYNLTMPERAKTHIQNIFEAHATFCGLPTFNVLCNHSDLIPRLVWASAGVPRDAVNMFLQAIYKSVEKKEKAVSVTSINIACAEALNDKRRSIAIDSPDNNDSILTLLESIKDFCLDQSKSNAFLIPIKDNDINYETINKLIDLRFLHIINKSITPDKAGEKYIAVILDYGFYVGLRKSRIPLFKEKLDSAPSVTELRKLPKLRFKAEK